MNNENNFNGEVSTKSKSKKIIIISVVALIILLVGVGVYAAINSNPKVKIFNALKATGEELKNKETLTQKIAGKDYLKDLEEKGITQNMKFTLNSTNLEELKALSGAGISIDSSIDQKNKKLMFNIGGQYKGTSVVDAKFYTDNKKLMISVPKIYNSWFTCDAENIQEQYNNSPFYQGEELSDQDITLKLFDDDNTEVISNKEVMDKIVKSYLKANADKLATVGKNIKVEKSKATKTIDIGGTSQECVAYDVVISGQDMKTLIESICDYALEDPEVKKIMTESAKYSYIQEDKKYDSPEAMVEDMYKEMKTSSEKFKNSVTCEDVNAVVYLDKKDRAVSIELNSAIAVDSDKLNIKYSSDFKGKDNIGDIIKMSMELSSDTETLKVDLDNSTTTKDDTIKDDMNLVLSIDKTPVNITMNSEYNTKSGDFNASADMTAEGQGLTASCNGNTQYDKSSKKLQLDFDKIDLKSTINSSPINISLDGSYSVSALDKTIEEPTDEKLEVFKLSEDKILEISQEMQTNAMGLANTFK